MWVLRCGSLRQQRLKHTPACCLPAAPPSSPISTRAPGPQGMRWSMDMLRLALRPGLASPRALPRLLFADELERLNATAWLAFERVLMVHNRWVG